MAKKLLIENCVVDGGIFKEVPSVLTESSIEGQKVGVLRTIQGPQGVIDIATGNGRIYPEREILNAIKTLQPKMEGRLVTGNGDHPSGSPSVKDISHFLTKLWVENYNGVKYLFGEWVILDTPMGRILNTVYEAGGGAGSSLRGYGNVEESTGMVSDYELCTVDFVSDPSASTYISEKNFREKKTLESNEFTKESAEKIMSELKTMVESLKAEQSKLEESKIKMEEEMKIKAMKDLTIDETSVKAGETVEVKDESKIANLKAGEDFEKVVENKDIESLERKLKVESAKVKDLTAKLSALKEYALKAEKVGDIISEELRKTVTENTNSNKAVSELKKYAVTLENLIDTDLAQFMSKTVNSLEEMTKYSLKLEETIDKELVPYATKLEKVIDEELVPYTKKLETTLDEVIQQVKSGKIYENLSQDHVALVEKAIDTYPTLSSFKEELLQTRDEEHLQERLHKYLVVFANRGQSKDTPRTGSINLVKESSQVNPMKDGGDIVTRFSNIFETSKLD